MLDYRGNHIRNRTVHGMELHRIAAVESVGERRGKMLAALAMLVGIGLGIFMGCVTDSVIIGLIVGFIGAGFLAGKVFEADATVAQATQPQRDKQIISELKKMNDKE